jgi:hypothetical protein
MDKLAGEPRYKQDKAEICCKYGTPSHITTSNDLSAAAKLQGAAAEDGLWLQILRLPCGVPLADLTAEEIACVGQVQFICIPMVNTTTRSIWARTTPSTQKTAAGLELPRLMLPMDCVPQEVRHAVKNKGLDTPCTSEGMDDLRDPQGAFRAVKLGEAAAWIMVELHDPKHCHPATKEQPHMESVWKLITDDHHQISRKVIREYRRKFYPRILEPRWLKLDPLPDPVQPVASDQGGMQMLLDELEGILQDGEMVDSDEDVQMEEVQARNVQAGTEQAGNSPGGGGWAPCERPAGAVAPR